MLGKVIFYTAHMFSFTVALEYVYYQDNLGVTQLVSQLECVHVYSQFHKCVDVYSQFHS